MDQAKVKKIRIATHGLRGGGFNPTHNLDGYRQITQLALQIVSATPHVPMIMCGIGERFQEVLDAVCNAGVTATRVLYSPLFGTHAGLDTREGGVKIIPLGADRIIDYGAWYWTPPHVIDYWKLLDDLPDGTVICAGGELMLALGGEAIKGRLFEISLDTCNITDITDD